MRYIRLEILQKQDFSAFILLQLSLRKLKLAKAKCFTVFCKFLESLKEIMNAKWPCNCPLYLKFSIFPEVYSRICGKVKWESLITGLSIFLSHCSFSLPSHLWLGLLFPNLIRRIGLKGAPYGIRGWLCGVLDACFPTVLPGWRGPSAWSSHGALSSTTLIPMKWLRLTHFGKEVWSLI